MIVDLDKVVLYTITANKGKMHVVWCKDIYFPVRYEDYLAKVKYLWQDTPYSLYNSAHLSSTLHNFFTSINKESNIYLKEINVPYIAPAKPYIFLRARTKLKDETHYYIPAMPAVATPEETRLDKVEKKLDRLAKHLGKLTNELKKPQTISLNVQLPGEVHDVKIKESISNTHTEKKSSGRTLNDLPEIHLDRRDIYQLQTVVYPPKQLKLLCLDISPFSGGLRILYKKKIEKANSDKHMLGYVYKGKSLEMPCGHMAVDRYEKWLTEDKNTDASTIDSTSIFWEGYFYAIISRPTGYEKTGGIFLHNTTLDQDIYNFSKGIPCTPVSDVNIKVYRNGTPIIE